MERDSEQEVEVIEDENLTSDESTTELQEESSSDDPIRAEIEKSFKALSTDDENSEEEEKEGQSPPKTPDLRTVRKNSDIPAAKQSMLGPDSKEGEAVEPPLSWKAEEREMFKSLPSPLQQTLARRESERERAFSTKMRELSEYGRKYDGLEDVFTPEERNELLRNGVGVGELLGQFVGMQRWLMQNPKQAIRHIAASHKLSPQDLLDDDIVDQVDPRVQKLESQLGALVQYVQGNQMQQHQSHVGNVRSSIVAFASMTDEKGQPLRPYFEAVYQDMLPIVDRLSRADPDAPLEKILSEAYDRAIYANPETRATVLAAEHAKRMKEEKKKAERARFAGSSVRGNPTAATMTSSYNSNDIVGMINEIYDDLST